MAERCAIVGIGQTHHQKRREESIAGLCREAVLRALEDAGRTFAEVDAVVLGKTPDVFDGLLHPEHYLSDALGAVDKPIMRISTAGSVGGHTAIQAAHMVMSGRFQTVLAVAYAKESEGDINWAVQGGGMPFQTPLVAGPGGYFSLHIRDYIERAKAAPDVGIRVALKDRQNARLNPYAHVRMDDVSYEQIRDSPMLWDPIRLLETCPSSDGACALVLTNDRGASHCPSAPPAWILGMAARTESGGVPFRDQVNPLAGRDCAKHTYAMAGITRPRYEIDLAELYAPFSWMEPMWLENMGLAELNGGGARMVERGETALGGSFPVDPSGGVLGANPTGATGMIRFAEAALQVRGQAGAHQVDGARIALGHAQGGAASYLATWLVGAARP